MALAYAGAIYYKNIFSIIKPGSHKRKDHLHHQW